MASLDSSLGFSSTSAVAPPCNEMDNFLCEIISAVNLQGGCDNCDNVVEPSSHCTDCGDLLCDPCVNAHTKVRITKDHQIRRLPNKIIQSPISSIDSTGCASSNASSSPSPPIIQTICDNHREPNRLFCETCVLPICSECTLIDHNGHTLTYLQDALESASTTNFKLTTEVKAAQIAVREAMESVQRMSTRVDMKVYNTALEIRNTFKRFMNAIEKRESELLGKVDQIRRFKATRLSTQMDNLRVAQTKLYFVSEVLSDSLDSSNNIDLIVANERAGEELKRIRAVQSELSPCEDESIFFISPESPIFRAICTLGGISSAGGLTSLSNLGSLGSISRPGATRASPPLQLQLPAPEPLDALLSLPELFSAPLNRPIFGADHAVTVKSTGPQPSFVFGIEGEADGQLCRPWGVCCTKMGQIVVADRSNNRIQIFDCNGKFLHKFGSQGSGMGQFDRPAGIAINPAGNVVVADKDNHRVQIFKLDGQFVLSFGEKGTHNGQFNYPWDVSCNSQGHIVVSDTRNHRIQLFNSEGMFLNKYGFEGTSAMWKHFDSPRGVCFTPKGEIMVTDFNNHRVVIVDKHFSQAQFLGTEGSNVRQFLRPQGILCDDQGQVVIADSRNNRIQVLDSTGNFMFKLGQSGKNIGEFDRPSGICLTPHGRIVVVDFGNNRVQIY